MSGRALPRLRAKVGSLLRAQRHARGWSQAQLGEAARLSGKFIGEVERGDKSISLDSLGRIAAALRLPVVDLVPR